MDQSENKNDNDIVASEVTEKAESSSYEKERSANDGKKRARRIVLSVVAFILLAAIILSLPALSDFRNSMIRRVVQSTVLMHDAKVLKADVKDLAKNIKTQDIHKARASEYKMQEDVLSVKKTLNKPFWSAAGILPSATKELRDAKELLAILEEADETVISPLLSLMEEYPFSGLKTDSGLYDAAITAYIRFFESALPHAKDFAVRLKPMNLRRFDSGGSLTRLIGEMDEIIALLDLAEEAGRAVADVERNLFVDFQIPGHGARVAHPFGVCLRFFGRD